jgi:hypothetical protein
MKKHFPFLITICLSLFIFNYSTAQDKSKLDELHGFKGIKLGSFISEYDFLVKYTYDNQNDYNFRLPGCIGVRSPTFKKYYSCLNCENYFVKIDNDKFKEFGGQKILSMTVSAYKNQIYNIHIDLFSSNSYYQYLQFEEAFGKPNGQIKYGYETLQKFEEYLDKGLYATWRTEKTFLSLYGVNCENKWKGSLRGWYFVEFDDILIDEKASKEEEENKHKEELKIDKLRNFK